MNRTLHFCLSLLLFLSGAIYCLQFDLCATVIKIDGLQTYKQPVEPELLDNYLFATYYSSGKKAYNLRGYDIVGAGNRILDLKINPAGYSFAVLCGKNGKNSVRIKSLNPKRNIDTELKGLIAPTAITFMPDSRQLAVADDGKIKFFNSKTFEIEGSIPLAIPAEKLVISLNGNLILSQSHGKIQVLSPNSGDVRNTIYIPSQASVAYYSDGSQFGVLTEEGELTLYSSADFSEMAKFEGLGHSTNLFFISGDNYAGMVSDGNRVQFVNLFDNADRPIIYDNDLSWSKFIQDGKGNNYLATSGGNIIKYRKIQGFQPNYTQLLQQMVEDRMREWTKMRPGETELEYRERVNEESMRNQRIFFANEAATELGLAAGLGAFSDITLGRYNPSDGTLIVSLGGLNDIYLKVPQEDMAGFGDGNNLQFSNHVFSITPENKFELIYVEVFNPTNGKNYTFDNLDHQNLDFLNSDSGFVSLDLILQSSREDVLLKGIKDRIIEEARRNNILSDHTIVNVETYIKPDIDPNGNRISNYHIDFNYMVDAVGSDKEDFAPGKYRIDQSSAARSLAQIICQALSNEFAPYIVPGKTLAIEITGAADALPINGSIAYDGSMGEYEDEPCYIDDYLTAISVNAKEGIRSNEQLAFMRAQGIRHNMELNLPLLSEMKIKYRNNIEVSKEKGAKYRRINVSLVFFDAF